jgi:hypothetical protein
MVAPLRTFSGTTQKAASGPSIRYERAFLKNLTAARWLISLVQSFLRKHPNMGLGHNPSQDRGTNPLALKAAGV